MGKVETIKYLEFFIVEKTFSLRISSWYYGSQNNNSAVPFCPAPSSFPPIPSSSPVDMEGTKPKEANEEHDQEDTKEAKDKKDVIKEAKEEKVKFIDKVMLQFAILIVAISSASRLASGVMIPSKPILKIFYRVNIFLTWATFSAGLACVALCSVLHKPAEENLPVTL